MLINELNHRVKNSLVMVQSLARQLFTNATSLAAARLLLQSRTHDRLIRENRVSADILGLTCDVSALNASSRTSS